jgi:hypothetical protein
MGSPVVAETGTSILGEGLHRQLMSGLRNNADSGRIRNKESDPKSIVALRIGTVGD